MLKIFFVDDFGFKELGGFVYLLKLVGVVILGFVVCDYVKLIYDFVVCCELIKVGKNIVDGVVKVDVDSDVEE